MSANSASTKGSPVVKDPRRAYTPAPSETVCPRLRNPGSRNSGVAAGGGGGTAAHCTTQQFRLVQYCPGHNKVPRAQTRAYSCPGGMNYSGSAEGGGIALPPPFLLPPACVSLGRARKLIIVHGCAARRSSAVGWGSRRIGFEPRPDWIRG